MTALNSEAIRWKNAQYVQDRFSAGNGNTFDPDPDSSDLRVHPVVTKLVEKGALEKLGATPSGEATA